MVHHGFYSWSIVIGVIMSGGRGTWSEEGKDKYLLGFGEETLRIETSQKETSVRDKNLLKFILKELHGKDWKGFS